MPYQLRKVNNRRCYSVKNLKKKKTFSKCTSKKKALKQIRLLRALQNNKSFKPTKKYYTKYGREVKQPSRYNPTTGNKTRKIKLKKRG